MKLENNIYLLFYELEDIQPNLQIVIDFISQKIDQSEPMVVINAREEGRLLLPIISKCCVSADFFYRRVEDKKSREGILLGLLRDHTAHTRQDLQSCMISFANLIRHFNGEKL